MKDDDLDGCDLDFMQVPPTSPKEAEAQLVPEGEEKDEDDDGR